MEIILSITPLELNEKLVNSLKNDSNCGRKNFKRYWRN